MLDIKKLRELREISDAAFAPMCERDDIERCAEVLPEALDEIERLQNENNQLHKDLDHYKKVSEIASRGLAEAVRRGE